MSISAEVDERTLREIYLPAFEHVVTRARPATVMCAYSKINGTYASEHHWLLTQVLRDEWGFDGVVMSDWGGVHDRVAALRAGLDLQMPGDGGVADAAVAAALAAGELEPAPVEVSAARVARLAVRHTLTRAEVDFATHHALARSLAPGCMVLLKNDNQVLPLVGSERVAVIGPFATSLRFQGAGSSTVNPTQVDVMLDELRALVEARGGTVAYAPGFDLSSDESESFDRDHLDLPLTQQELIRSVARASPRTAVVLTHGGVVRVEGWHQDVDAILDAFLLGQAAGGPWRTSWSGWRNPLAGLPRPFRAASRTPQPSATSPARSARSATAKACWSVTGGMSRQMCPRATRSATVWGIATSRPPSCESSRSAATQRASRSRCGTCVSDP